MRKKENISFFARTFSCVVIVICLCINLWEIYDLLYWNFQILERNCRLLWFFFVINTCFFFLLYTGNLSKVCHNYESILTMIYIFDLSVLIMLLYFLFSLWPNVQTTKFFQWIPHICQPVKVTKHKIYWLQMKFDIIIESQKLLVNIFWYVKQGRK